VYGKTLLKIGLAASMKSARFDRVHSVGKEGLADQDRYGMPIHIQKI
jgi:hypothetical protein